MNKILLFILFALSALPSSSQTILSKTTIVAKSVTSSLQSVVMTNSTDTIYKLYIEDKLHNVTITFIGRNAVAKTLNYLNNLDMEDGYLIQLDYSVGKNTVMTTDNGRGFDIMTGKNQLFDKIYFNKFQIRQLLRNLAPSSNQYKKWGHANTEKRKEPKKKENKRYDIDDLY